MAPGPMSWPIIFLKGRGYINPKVESLHRLAQVTSGNPVEKIGKLESLYDLVSQDQLLPKGEASVPRDTPSPDEEVLP